MIKTGIFGGSFNPIHNGHVSLAQQLKEKAGLDEVWLMVSPQNPLKQNVDLLDDEKRLEMARLALEVDTGALQACAAGGRGNVILVLLIVGNDGSDVVCVYRHCEEMVRQTGGVLYADCAGENRLGDTVQCHNILMFLC